MLWCFLGQQENSYVYHNFLSGYYYHCSYILTSAAYFKCQRYGRGCRARAIFYESGEFVEGGFHNHDRNFHLPQTMDLRQRIISTTRNFPSLTFRQIVHQEGRRFPALIRSMVTVNSMRHVLRRVRLENYPPHMPHTNEELGAILTNPAYAFISQSDDQQDNLFARVVVDSEGSTHIIFISQRMRDDIQNCDWLFLDGHFASRPVSPPMAQILNIATTWDHHGIYVGSVFMMSRTEPAFSSVFEGLLQLMPRLNPSHIGCDFERAQQNALATHFPFATIVGCLWHFCRAVVKKARQIGFALWLPRSRLIRHLLRMCCSLALLPHDLIPYGVYLIGMQCYERGSFVYGLFYPLLQYLHTYWVSDPLRCITMSVYGCEHRTNNILESLNRYMRSEVGAHHPNIYALLECLSRMEGIAHAQLRTLERGQAPTRGRSAGSLINDQRLQRLARTLQEQPFGLEHAVSLYLSHGSNAIRNAVNDLMNFEEQAPPQQQ